MEHLVQQYRRVVLVVRKILVGSTPWIMVRVRLNCVRGRVLELRLRLVCLYSLAQLTQ